MLLLEISGIQFHVKNVFFKAGLKIFYLALKICKIAYNRKALENEQ
jgi:hypothetical protein